MEKKLIKLLLNKDFYEANKHYVKRELFSDQLLGIFDVLIKAHEKYTTGISVQDLQLLYKEAHPAATRASLVLIDELFKRIEEEQTPNLEAAKDILQGLWRRENARQIAEAAIEIVDGRKLDFSRVQEIVHDLGDDYLPATDLDITTTDIDELLAKSDMKDAYAFNIPSVAAYVPGILPSRFMVLSARPETGKCLGENTSVMMADGSFRFVQDIKIGDKLMGPDSKPRNVLSIASGVDDLYKIKYPWGDFYVTNSVHILSLKRSHTETCHKHGDILNVPLNEYLQWPEGRKHRYKGWKTGIDFLEQEVTIPPYIFGMWLGDGHSSSPCFTNTDEKLIDILKEFAYSAGFSIKQDGITYSLQETIRMRINRFSGTLKYYGVYGNKHIPDIYKFQSRQNRLELLAGIIDTDGYNTKNGSYQIMQKNKYLALDILWLARSLGFHAIIKQKEKGCQTGVVGTYYDISIYNPGLWEIPVRLDYKKIERNENTKRKGLLFGIEVEPIGKGNYYGFTLDGDNLFLLDDFTVTHNTAAWVSLTFGPGGFLDQGLSVHAIINEEPASATMMRGISCRTGMTYEQVASNRAMARGVFEKIKDQVQFVDSVDMSIDRLDLYCKTYKPNILVVDQLDKLSVDGEYARDDQKLREIYVGARRIAKRHNTAIIAVSQLSFEAEGRRIVSHAMAENSRTGKAAEADIFIAIGKNPINENSMNDDFLRYWNITKNKLTGRHGTATCRIIPEISRYEE